MAKTELDAFGELMAILKAASTEGVDAAQEAAAQVFLKAAIAAAPVAISSETNRPSGQLKSSIAIVKGIDKLGISSGIYGSTVRLLVGPTKKKGFYGYFVEHGHKTAGPHRIKRAASGNTHSQSGTTSHSYVVAKPWFDNAIQDAENEAMSAAQKAFDAKLQEIDSRN